MQLRDIAHSRTGDKGDHSNISVIAHDPADYPFLRDHLTAALVAETFAPVLAGRVERYELDSLGALNFVLRHALGGGVTVSLALDAHGKCLASAMLAITLPDPPHPRAASPAAAPPPPSGPAPAA
ncbi:hypothetical protein ICN82_03595 [Mangrovicoccus sp. HB182678]|uniref:AtuA-like ferredoxin-fold domain-containing protein n=1 Tax=Mangrovicoccus algicola TaxID=2771008 RepID=A0A8J6Z4A6_9RHOB|nr:hypothetical protein [Mangrovicoccus algicola]